MVDRCCWLHDQLTVVCDPPTNLCQAVEKARAGIETDYPYIDWHRSPVTRQIFERLAGDYFLDEHPTVSLVEVKAAWLKHWKACLPF